MKYKPKRSILSIDKIAMVALPLIILFFLLMTARPKTWFNSAVDLPQATTFNISDTDGDYIHILLKQGKCALVIDSELRSSTLLAMGKKHDIVFSPQQINKFSKMTAFGASMKKMTAFINTHSQLNSSIDDRFGIPIDSATDELSEWIKIADKKNQQLNSRGLRIALLCDKDEPYTNIKLIRDALKKDSISRISIIYNSKPLNN